MQTAPIAIEATQIQDTRAAYLELRDAWRQRARDKANSAWDFIDYTLKRADLLSEKLGKDGAEAWALTKLREAFTPSKAHGRATVERYLRPLRTYSAMSPRYRELATYCYDEMRTEA